MTTRTQTDAVTGETLVTFEVADDVHDGVVSVVGSFNHWTPGVDVLQRQEGGTLSVTVKVEPGSDVHFRYLGSGGVWFDDPVAESTEYGSVIRLGDTQTSGSASEPSRPSSESAQPPGASVPTKSPKA
jgi:1,4-alpha-glucan branching enzyme